MSRGIVFVAGTMDGERVDCCTLPSSSNALDICLWRVIEIHVRTTQSIILDKQSG